MHNLGSKLDDDKWVKFWRGSSRGVVDEKRLVDGRSIIRKRVDTIVRALTSAEKSGWTSVRKNVVECEGSSCDNVSSWKDREEKSGENFCPIRRFHLHKDWLDVDHWVGASFNWEACYWKGCGADIYRLKIVWGMRFEMVRCNLGLMWE